MTSATTPAPDLIDLAARALGGGVMAANDESFGEKESLIVPPVAGFLPGRYGHKGELVDGWETRRRREPGDDWAIVRLAAPGVVARVDVDTTSFTGNFPSHARLEGCTVDGHPSVAELQAASWRELVPWTPLTGDAHHLLDAVPAGRVTHVRLVIRPDGGVARLRVLGRVTPDPRRFEGLTVDLAAAELGGLIEAGSDEFYSSPTVLLLPGTARTMGEGWETRRNRAGGHDWLVIRLAAAGVLREIEVDTSYYVANASGEVAVWGRPVDGADWLPVLPRTALQPDTRHVFAADRFAPGGDVPFTHVRLDAFPDGGMSRIRFRGQAVEEGLAALRSAWSAG